MTAKAKQKQPHAPNKALGFPVCYSNQMSLNLIFSSVKIVTMSRLKQTVNTKVLENYKSCLKTTQNPKVWDRPHAFI